MIDQVITHFTGTEWEARIDGILCCGLGATEADAIRRLASVLGDFVRGHVSTIDRMRAQAREIAGDVAIVEAEGSR